ncbi:alanyl-tRNA editing protein [Vibrio maerlii]|uniref:alanyl-tRNA editing protein n=1 Tax=Vibrio maerlii TaxID=2231648 RepID=UPI000E3C7487|nr:alanyl-tRNA editing protein [Vibrio maerlii]
MKITPTKILFCHNQWHSAAQVQLVVPSIDNGVYLVADKTPFHPVSHIWPDHPADQGEVRHGDKVYSVKNCLVGAVDLENGELYVDKAIPVKRDTQGWAFVVVHELTTPLEEINVESGDEIQLNVDQEYQQSLSRGHSAGHIAYLALNKVLNQAYWRKDADRKDPLGHYDFNSYAQETSFVHPDRCVDTYRLGKTLRKRGLNSANMLEDLEQVTLSVNEQVKQWLATGSAVSMRLEGESLTDSRYWSTTLDGKALELPCGGTHINHTDEYSAISVELHQIDAQTIEMHTTVTNH